MTKTLKIFLILCLLVLATGRAYTQITIKPEPAAGYEERIRMAIDTMPVVDTHEHLPGRTAMSKSKTLDFMFLFHQYADDDIKSAGMSKPQFAELMTDKLSISEKWEIMKPYYEASFNTAYNRNVLLSVEKLFGIKEFNEETVHQISDKLKEAYQTDWYNTVLREKCRISFLIKDSRPAPDDPDFFRYTTRFDYFRLNSKEEVEKLAEQHKTKITSLSDLETTLVNHFEEEVKKGITTIKNSAAYHRSLFFEDVSRKDAEKVFRKVYKSNEPLDSITIKPLGDYMMHRILDLAGKHNVPVQIHTGLQAGDGNFLQNSNPALLANLFLKYRNVKFILFHGGYPYGGEFGSFAKNFRNVYIDLCWLYIISPSYSKRYLHEWLETVPANKILAFGGDYENVENVYGHLLFAKEIITGVLVEKVKSGYFTEEEAVKVAKMILHDNAINLFNLK